MTQQTLQCEHWGTIPYQAAWRRQEAMRVARRQGTIPDTFVICEHPPVFTLGKQDCQDDWQATFPAIRAAGIEIVQSNRGGRITYHGPGQLVGYFIVDLRAMQVGVAEFVRRIESLLIETVAPFGVDAVRDPVNPGVYVGRNKLGAIGLHVSQQITQHGFALNIDPNMAHYQYILPCGLQDHGITSLRQLLGDRCPSFDALAARLRTLLNNGSYSAASNVGSASASLAMAGAASS